MKPRQSGKRNYRPPHQRTQEAHIARCNQALNHYHLASPIREGRYPVRDINGNIVALFDYKADAELFVKAHNKETTT